MDGCVVTGAAKGLMALVCSEASRLLGDLEFKKRAGAIFTKPIADDMLGWLGLNHTTRRDDGRLEINPVIGVRHQSLERIVAELSGERVHPYIPPTAAIHLGYLMPQQRYTPWFIEGPQDVEGSARGMVDAITVYGMPFLEANSSLERLLATLHDGKYAFRHMVVYRIPVGYLLLDEVTSAESALHRFVAEMADRRDAAADNFRAFALELEQRLVRRESP
jgi:hypothetical protein